VFLARFEKYTFRMKFGYMGIANVKECGQGKPRTFYARNPRIQLTQRSRVLLEKPAVPHLVHKLPTFYGKRKFITAFTRTRQLSLSPATSMQATPIIFLKDRLYYYPPIYA
jgi:hypothetical protein